MRIILLGVVIILNTLLSCVSTKKVADYEPVFEQGPPVIVYKTRADYNDKVPVLLSADFKTIVGYPDPMDLKDGEGGLMLPVGLRDGYLLDNKGIQVNTAFLSISYQDYAALTVIPSLDSLNSLIIDRTPFTEIWNCGSRAYLPQNSKDALNKMIKNGQFSKKCKRLL